MSDEIKEMMRILNEHLAVKREDGSVALQVALIATVYFEDAYKREVREAVVSCCEDYFRRCGAHLRWALNADKKDWDPYGQGMASEPGAWLPARPEDEGFDLIYHGGERILDANAFTLTALGAERRPYVKLGHFKVSFPLLWFADNPGSLPGVLLELCRKLKPVSGYGGIGINECPDPWETSEYAPVVYAWAQHFPGLEADYPIAHGLSLGDGREDGRGGIKGVNWLTVVSDRWLAELGGADMVTSRVSALDSRFIVHRYEGGVLIQAGPHPELGNAELNVWPELYVKLAKYLKPIRITKAYLFQLGGPGPRFDLERSNAWLRRFDDR